MTTTQIDHDPANGCPKCKGPLWDNRTTKRNPKAPDFKCRDRSCDGVIWHAPVAPIAPTPATNVKQPLSSGPPLPWETENLLPLEKLDRLFAVYGIIEDHVLATSVPKFTKAQVGASPESVAAQCATLLIAFQRAGQ